MDLLFLQPGPFIGWLRHCTVSKVAETHSKDKHDRFSALIIYGDRLDKCCTDQVVRHFSVFSDGIIADMVDNILSGRRHLRNVISWNGS